MRRSTRLRIALGCLTAWAVPCAAPAELFQGSSGSALALVSGSPANVQATPGPNDLSVTLAGTASDVTELPDDQWLVDFAYDASVLGGGSVTWGSASGNLLLEASSVPQFAPPAPGNTGKPLANIGSSQADGTLHFRSTELGTITSATLPAGTPVTVELYCRVDAWGFVSGSLDWPDDTRVGGSAQCRITDHSGGLLLADISVGVNELESKSFATAVGRQLEIEGVFYFTAKAFAGVPLCCTSYLGDVSAGIDGSGGLWLGLPAGVDVQAASGHDYTVPVPEPGGTPSALAVGIALLGLGRVAHRTCS